MTTTLVRVLLRQSLPDKYKQYADRLWDKGTVESESHQKFRAESPAEKVRRLR